MNPFNDPHGKFSASKFWTQVAYATATYLVIVHVNSENWELLLVYIATVGGSEVAKKFLNMRYPNGTNGNEIRSRQEVPEHALPQRHERKRQ